MFKNILKHFLWGKVGKYQIFFVTLQRNSEKDRLKAVRSWITTLLARLRLLEIKIENYEHVYWKY